MTDSPAILLVDDDAANRRIASAVLQSAGWHVDDVADGASAVAAVRVRRYSLILLDIQMPDMDGYETAAAIRAEGRSGLTAPILAFTALRLPDALDRARAASMDGHIAKPFTPDVLIEAVARWCPDAIALPTTRLVKIFGEAELAGLLQRFHIQLKTSLSLAAADGSLRDDAHKLAGIAGTLGFADISRHWLAVSEGDADALPDARTATRSALIALGKYDTPAQPD